MPQTKADCAKTEILHLTLYRKWFDLIAAGSKVVEYRQDSEHWHKRIFNNDGSNKHFNTIHFRNGYGKHRPLMVAEFFSAFVTHSDLCACVHGEKLDGLVIVIAIGNKIRFENYQPPWSCAGCGVLVSLEESLCPHCTAQLCNGGVAWTDCSESDQTTTKTADVTRVDSLTTGYRPVPLDLIPDCCGVCQAGDADGEGCEVLSQMGFSKYEKRLDEGFNYFSVCESFERITHDPVGR